MSAREAMQCVQEGMARQQQGDWSGALRCFERARRIDPARGNQISVANCLTKLARYDEALRICDTVLGEERDYTPAVFAKIDALLGAKRYQELIEYTEWLASELGAGNILKVKEARETALRHVGGRA